MERLEQSLDRVADALGKLAEKVDTLGDRMLRLEERTSPIVEWFWKAVGFILIALVSAGLALVVRGQGGR